MATLLSLLEAIEPDPWRRATGFSSDLSDANELAWSDQLDRDALAASLNSWLRGNRNQPCLFGRIAAAKSLLSYSVITEADIMQGDEHVRDRIQEDRRKWRALARRGKSHGFIVWLVSKRLAFAKPSSGVYDIAARFLQLYLRLDEVQIDTVYHEQVYLNAPDMEELRLLRWHGGVNLFSAAGDRRWWHDHRIPGGIALSVNSVGHMVKAKTLGEGLRDLLAELGIKQDGAFHKIGSLNHALVYAMQTIQNASHDPWEAATSLLLANGEAPPSGVTLPNDLLPFSVRSYRGFYHTDATLPSLYFMDVAERPRDATPFELDFTYLWDRGVDNPAFETMGDGVLISGHARCDASRIGKRLEGELLSSEESTRVLRELE